MTIHPYIADVIEYYEKRGWQFDVCTQCGLLVEIVKTDITDGPSLCSAMYCQHQENK